MVELKLIQQAQIDILKVIMTTLDKHDIKPFLIAGSCLGAIRHGGIIPWDDDIDVGLLREDYEKAREILTKELPEGYIYCDHLTEKEYPYNFGKVRKQNSAFVHGGDAHLNIHQGIYVDIFPFDYTPDSIEEFKKQYKPIKRIRRKIDLASMSYKKYGKLRPIWQLPLVFYGHVFVNKKREQKKLDALVQEYNLPNKKQSGEYICNYLGIWGEKERAKTQWLGKLKEMEFSGVKCVIPEDYDAYLKALYGDYMKPPPEDKRVSHHDIIFCSLDEEYKN